MSGSFHRLKTKAAECGLRRHLTKRGRTTAVLAVVLRPATSAATANTKEKRRPTTASSANGQDLAWPSHYAGDRPADRSAGNYGAPSDIRYFPNAGIEQMRGPDTRRAFLCMSIRLPEEKLKLSTTSA